MAMMQSMTTLMLATTVLVATTMLTIVLLSVAIAVLGNCYVGAVFAATPLTTTIVNAASETLGRLESTFVLLPEKTL